LSSCSSKTAFDPQKQSLKTTEDASVIKVHAVIQQEGVCLLESLIIVERNEDDLGRIWIWILSLQHPIKSTHKQQAQTITR
jgi:hypothetical protein